MATTIVVFLVIVAGAIVRASGAGMGCPDWPRCFGLLIPPTDVSQLPLDYMERFAKGQVVVERFNAVKTWTEYINRLLGALSGVFALGTLVAAIRARKSVSGGQMLIMSILGLALLFLVAWMGKTVVATNLNQVKITLHYLVAVGITVVFALITMRAGQWGFRLPMAGKVGLTMKVLSIVLVLLTLLQLVIGIQVRELIDHNADFFGLLEIDKWINEKVMGVLEYHARLIFILVAVLLAQGFYARKYVRDSDFYKLVVASIVLVTIQGIAGSAMVRFDFLPIARVFHVFGGALLFTFAFSSAYLLFTAPSLKKYRQDQEVDL